MHTFAHYLWGRERICPRCGKIWRLGATSHQTLIAFGIVVGLVLAVEAWVWFPSSEANLLVLVLWLPLYTFVLWPAIFALLGNYRLK